MTELLLSVVILLAVGTSLGHGDGYSSGHNQGGYQHQHQQQQQQHQGYQQSYTYSYKKPTKNCYQCAYSPPKTYYDKKVVVEKHEYGQQQQGYGSQGGYGNDKNQGYGTMGGYTKKTVIPVARTVNGGWDKCLGPFDHYQARDFGIDVWECHSNCYTRKDPNGDIFRGCYKGEYGVDPYRQGCSYQAGSLWCFCEGDKCNSQAAGAGGYQ